MTQASLTVRPIVPQARFLAMPQKFRAYVAGFGCVQKDTRIWTERGLMRICDISAPIRVLSWSEKDQEFQLSLTGGSYPKGRANLYRVLTEHGEFESSGHHRIFSCSGKFVPVDSLTETSVLSTCGVDLRATTSELVQRSLHEGDPHCKQIHADWLGRYADAARQYGQQFLRGGDIFRVSSPTRDDVPGLRHTGGRLGGRLVRKLAHSHPYQFSGQNDRMRYLFPSYSLSEVERLREGAAHSEHAVRNNRESRQPLGRFSFCLERKEYGQSAQAFCRALFSVLVGYGILLYSGIQQFFRNSLFCRGQKQIDRGELLCRLGCLVGTSCSSFIKTSNVVSITRNTVEDVYYDMQVLDTNNYVDEFGHIHHNSGKTFAGGMALCIHHAKFPRVNSGYFAPTYPQIRDIFYPTIEEVAHLFGFSVQIKTSDHEVHYYSGGAYRATTICRSLDKPSSIIGFKIGHAMIDEFDTMKLENAILSWRKIIARMRYNLPELKNGIDVTTTPEGFLATHKLFVEDVLKTPALGKSYGLIQASTYDNAANLPDDYIPSLLEAYTPELVLAYVNGQFVNLKSGTVYRYYNRTTHNSTEKVKPEGEKLIIGMDFNVQKMAACVFVERGEAWHQVAELKELFDTPDMIRVLNDRYPAKIFRRIVYPDASGGSRDSGNASITDLHQLRLAGFEVRAHATNPFVKDRVNAVNTAFVKGKLFVNAAACPVTAGCLEKQAYDANGEPDKKSGFDHQNDGFSYPVAYEMPIIQSLRKVSVGGGL